MKILFFLLCLGLPNFVSGGDENLTSSSFGNFVNGFPCGFTFPEAAEASLRISKETAAVDGSEIPSTMIRIDKARFVRCLSRPIMHIVSGRKYLCSFLINFEDVNMASADGIRFYIYNTHAGRHYWMQVRGNGSTHGWVSVIFPFEGSFLQPEKGSCAFFIYFNEVTGIFRFADLVIIELPEGVNMEPAFTNMKGKPLATQILTLENVK